MNDFLLQEAKKYNVSAQFDINKNLPSFQITVKDHQLTIAAPDETELLYGVYDFAEKFNGFCFFEPGEDLFHADKVAKDLPDGVLIPARKPLLKNRGFIQEFPFDHETSMLFDWMAKNKLNYLQTWLKYYDDLSEKVKQEAKIRGITIESGHHSFNYWISGKDYGKSHPEFFAEINGKRIDPTSNRSSLLLSEQLCTTNPELRNELVKNMLLYCQKHPEIKYISLVPNDGFGWCECQNCSKFYDKNKRGDFYSISEHVYPADKIYQQLFNEVADKLHKKRPDIILTMCAYINYCRPSDGFKLKKGMAVNFAPYWRCVNHEIFDENCPINSHYKSDILAWSKIKDGGEINIYEYYMGVNFYLSLPLIHFREVFREIKWYADHHIDGILTQFHIAHWSVYGMNFYLMAKAARGENSETTIDEVFKNVFGDNAQKAKIFYTAVKDLLKNLGKCHITYPYAILSRTTEEDFKVLVEKAKPLQNKDLIIWCEYMLKFKQLFDTYHNGKLKISDVDDFLNWIKKSGDKRVFVHSKFATYFQALKDCLKNKKTWIHFNLDWEDQHILKQEKMFQKQQ
ncbi:MAG: DUF4838 domain-containing protein [Lentisphaeria bacterium]